jgi:hypothetical protein
VLSRGDAAGFTVHPKYKEKGRRIRVIDTGLDFFHYVDVRSTAASMAFVEQKSKYWNVGSGYKPSDLDDYYYKRLPRQFVAEYRGSHPASMRPRIQALTTRLDLKSPRWRTNLTNAERRRYLRTKLVEVFGWRAGGGKTSRKIVGSHRRDRALSRTLLERGSSLC